MNTRILFNFSASIEMLTGLAMIFVPGLVSGFLLGGELDQTGVALARILGVGMICLGISAWEREASNLYCAPRFGICTYNLSIAVMLAIFSIFNGIQGLLLWPVAAIHGLIAAGMVWVISFSPQCKNN